ncbi:hypothetical protein PFDG_05395, partial [Plasmodium falciparum Dd2]
MFIIQMKQILLVNLFLYVILPENNVQKTSLKKQNRIFHESNLL